MTLTVPENEMVSYGIIMFFCLINVFIYVNVIFNFFIFNLLKKILFYF